MSQDFGYATPSNKEDPMSQEREFQNWQKSEPIWRRLNPCYIARYDALAPLGDLVAKLTPECPCCAGFRMIGALLIGLGLGAWLL